MRQIAAAAGVSPGLVIRHSGSKDGLREAVDGHVLAMFGAMLGELATDDLYEPGSAGSLAEVIVQHLPPGSPVPPYLRRLLLDGGNVGRELFRRLHLRCSSPAWRPAVARTPPSTARAPPRARRRARPAAPGGDRPRIQANSLTLHGYGPRAAGPAGGWAVRTSRWKVPLAWPATRSPRQPGWRTERMAPATSRAARSLSGRESRDRV